MTNSVPRVMSRGTAHADRSFEQFIWDSDTESFEAAVNKNVERYAIDYTHKSGCDVVHDRLPEQHELAGMALAFRERPMPGSTLRKYTQQWMLGIMATTILAGVVLGIIVPFLRIGVIAALPFALLLGAFVGFPCLVRQVRTSVAIKWLYVPPLIVLVLSILSWLMVLRIPFLILSVGVALYSLHRHGSAIFSFYEDWLLTDPCISAEERNDHQEFREYAPSLLFAGFILIEATFVGFYNHTYALVIAAVTILAAFLFQVFCLLVSCGFSTFYKHVMSVLSQYLTYGIQTSGAPGVWHPPETVAQRRRNLIFMIATSSLALTYSLDGFMAVEMLPLDKIPGAGRMQLNDNIDAWIAGPKASMGWVYTAAVGIESGKAKECILAYPAAIFLSMTLCPLFFLTTFAIPMLKSMDLYEIVADEAEDEDRPEWQWYVDRMRVSDHETLDPVTGQVNREADHLFLGVEPVAHHPVILDKRILAEHAYIVGESGSGKTSMGVMPLLIQLIRGSTDGATIPNRFARDKIEVAETCLSCGATMKVWGPARKQIFQCPKCKSALPVDFRHVGLRDADDPPPPIVVIDLKGDPALFHTVREEAEARSPGSFRWFTPEKNFSSHAFNPFEDMLTGDRSFPQICELLLNSLGMDHGSGYGRSYYTRQSRMALLEALQSDPMPMSFAELMQRLVELQRVRPDDFADVAELTSTIRVLMEYPQLALRHQHEKPEQAIHMPAVLENRQVVYFWLPAALESVSVREIAKLALYSHLSAAIARQRSGQDVRQSYVVIDEFQRIVGDNFRILLEQARSFGLGVILSNQSRSDLETPSADLRSTVNTNTRLKMVFSVSDPQEIDDLQKVSGEEMIEFLSSATSESSTGGGGGAVTESVSAQNSIQPRLSTNEILSASDHPLDFLMQVSRSSGYTQYGGLPIRIRSNFPITRETYVNRSKMPWPQLEPYEVKERAGTVSQKAPEELEKSRVVFASDFEQVLSSVFERQQKKFQPDANGS